jgi:hypothetical protein
MVAVAKGKGGRLLDPHTWKAERAYFEAQNCEFWENFVVPSTLMSLGVQALLVVVIGTSFARLILAVILSPKPLADEAVYSATLQLITLSIAPIFTRLNHLYTRRSSTIFLVFYPLYLSAYFFVLRTQLALLRHGGYLHVANFSVCIGHASLTFVVWLLECVGPEADVDKVVKESPYVTANIYSR